MQKPSSLPAAPPDTQDVHYAGLADADKERILAFQQAILESVARGDAHLEIVNQVCKLEEQLVPNAVASVMLLDEERQALSVLAAPSMPPAGIARLNGLRPGPAAGSCGNVLYRQESVFVADTEADPRWCDLRDLAIEFDLRACWSVPVRSAGGKIVGTFALSSFERRAPTAFHRTLLEIGASIVGIVIERSKQADSLRLLDKVFESSRDGVMVTDGDLRIVSVNPAMVELTGFSTAELIGQTPEFLAASAQPAVSHALREDLARQGRVQREMSTRRKAGGEFPALLSMSAVRDNAGQVTHYVGFHFDISERKAAEAKIAFLAYHDPLTELPNRVLARERLAQAIALANRTGAKAALLFFDLDNFKVINDSLGHSVGDALLKAVAARISACTRETDTLSRLGGDEFLHIAANVANADAVVSISEKVLANLAEPFEIDGHELSTSVSMGVAVYPDDGEDFDTLLKKADIAMYKAKEAGRNTYRFYTGRMSSETLEHLKIRTGLRQALDQGQFVLHFQPQIELATGVAVGAEALIRWAHPDLGLLPPARFISIAEDSGLIVPIGEWVLREACQQAMHWRKASGMLHLVCAVNLSAPQFKRSDLEKSVVGALADSGLDPASLDLELTESILIQDTENVLHTVRRLKSLGVKLSIDDFGTGYSSLSYLKRFAVDKLKIDRSFVRGMADDPNDAAIVRAIIQMARSLGLRTIAEGVEDERLRALLLAHRCDEAQGFHFARPLPPDELLRFLEQQRTTLAL